MKKFILPLLLLLAVGMLAAVESDPSAVVGYFKKTVGDGAVQSIALPFAYPITTVDAILGMQLGADDVTQEINSGLSTTFVDGYGWDGGLTNMAYGEGYYIIRTIGSGSADYYLMGKVDPQGFTVPIYGNSSVNAFGLTEATAVPFIAEQHPFGANPVDGDVVQEIDSGLSATFVDGYGWDGGLTELLPTFSYYYISAAGSAGFSWTYTPVARGRVAQPSNLRTSTNRKVK